MEQLLYRSYARDGLLADQVFRIIESSARDNPVRDLTGFLIYAQDQFIQFLEGPAESIELLLRDLAADRRHRDLEVLHRAGAMRRVFPAWRMQRVDFRPGKVSEMLAELRDKGLSAPVAAEIEAVLAPRRAESPALPN